MACKIECMLQRMDIPPTNNNTPTKVKNPKTTLNLVDILTECRIMCICNGHMSKPQIAWSGWLEFSKLLSGRSGDLSFQQNYERLI